MSQRALMALSGKQESAQANFHGGLLEAGTHSSTYSRRVFAGECKQRAKYADFQEVLAFFPRLFCKAMIQNLKATFFLSTFDCLASLTLPISSPAKHTNAFVSVCKA